MSYFDDNIFRLAFGRTRRTTNKWTAVCKHCGQGGLKWRTTDNGWALFENERAEHNRLKRHDCQGKFSNPIDDFEVLD